MNNHLKYSAILLFLFYCCFVSYAQVETRHLGQNEEKDYWEEKNLELATTCRNIPIKALPVFDINKIIEEDADRDNNTSFRYGKAFDVCYSLNDGIWNETVDGRIWSLTVESPKALSLNFYFKDVRLPEGAYIYMKKYIYLAFALLLGSWTFISCGDEEDTIVDNTEPTVTIPADDSNFPPVYVNPSEMPENGIVIAYRLYNQDGKQTTAFKQSDDIIFDIQLYNMEDTIVYVMGERDGRPTLFPTPLVEEGIQTGIFNVYTAEGKFVDYPYNPVLTGNQTDEYNYYSLLAPAKKNPDYIARWTASWSGKQYEDFMVGRKYKYYLRGVKNGVLLPGEYYTEFDVNLRPTIKRKVRIDFTVTK